MKIAWIAEQIELPSQSQHYHECVDWADAAIYRGLAAEYISRVHRLKPVFG